MGLAEVGMALYLGMAALSLWHADPRPSTGTAKLLGLSMLVAWTVVTADLVPRIGFQVVARVVAGTALVTAAAAVAGVVLFSTGVPTPFVGTYG
ncbi:MAG TPA: hypothetical protein VIC87_00580, partial [Vicinamibacteria bacterium]